MNRDTEILIRAINDLNLRQHTTELVAIGIKGASQWMLYKNIPTFNASFTSMSLNAANALISRCITFKQSNSSSCVELS